MDIRIENLKRGVDELELRLSSLEVSAKDLPKKGKDPPGKARQSHAQVRLVFFPCQYNLTLLFLLAVLSLTIKFKTAKFA